VRSISKAGIPAGIAAIGCILLCAAAAAAAPADETVWISSLDLSKATQGWGNPQADQSVERHGLTLRGQTFPQGFGTHAPGALLIDLGDGARRFTATVGIDDEVGAGRGNAEFQVLGDDRRDLWRSGNMRAGDPPKQVDIDLSGLRQITLVSRPMAGRPTRDMPTGRMPG